MTSHLRPSEQDPADRPYEKNEMSWALSWAGPRTVLVPRTDQGFGFTLRHFIVYPPESASDHGPEGEIFTDENDPEGRRVKRTKLSSLEPMDTIFVKHVKDGGPAHQAGLNTGDRIVSVNGEPVTGKSYSQVIHLIQSSDSALKLLVVPKDEDILQMAYQTSVYDKSQESYRGYGDSMTSASQGNYVKVEHTGLAPTTEVTVTSRRGGWREELRKKYSTPIEESGYDPRTVSWQGGVSTREPLRTDSATNRGVDGRKGGFDIHISYNYPVSKTQGTYAAPTSPQKSSGYGLYYPVVRRDSRDRTDPAVGSQSRSNSNSSSNLSARHSQEIVVDTTGSQENVEKPHRWSRGSQDYSRSSQENMSYSRRSKEGLQFPDDSYTPSYSSNRSHTWDSSKFQSRPSHSSSENNVPRSLTTSSLSKMTNPTKVVDYTVPDSSNSGSNLKPVRYSVSTGSSSSTSSLPQNVSPTRLIQYNPPSAQSHRSAKSTSADNLQNAGSLSVHRANTVSSKPAHSVSNTRLRDYQEPKIPGRTFVVRIGDKVTVSPPPSQSQRDPVSINSTRTYPSGTTFALTRAPTATNSPYESRKNPQLPVSERKKQFEAGKRMEEIQAPASVTPPNYEMSASTKRYKTEIEKLQSLGKLGIVKRVAQFESSNSNSDSGESTPTRTEQTPPPPEVSPQNLYQQQTRTQQSPPTQYSAVQHEPCSVPQYSVVQQQHYQPVQQQQHQHSPVLQQQQQYIPTSQPAIKVRKIATERYQPSDSATNSRPNSLGTSVPVRVLMSHSTSAPNSPTVEEGKSIEDGVRAGSMRSVDPHGMSVSMVNPPLRMDSVEGTFLSAEKGGSSNSSRPMRKVSYLTAVNAPISKQVMTASSENLDRAGCKSDQPSPHPHADSMVSPAATSPVHKSASTSNVVMRKKTEAAEEEGIKLHRRTSYLMATAKDRTTLTLPLNKTAPPNTQDLHTSPSKSINLKKLKLKFGEKTPRITEGQEGGKRLSQDLNSPIQEVVKEGILHCKTAITDGKRASDRSWKPMWAVLKGHALYLVHARKDGSWNANDEQLISIKSCLVDIANDYTKKKHVFRLKTYNGCEYLLQADDAEAMAEWISAIQSNNDPDGDEKGVVMTDFMLRKTTQYEQTTNNTSKTSPQTQPKSKKLSGLSFKAKMPYSPNVKRKKPPDDGARSKTWKGKFKSFRPRLGGGATSNAEEETTPTGTFGVPLEDCVPSPNNEFVPLIVEICTKIVELRGVEVVGIYRVPGNTAAVHMMQDELNRGFENMSSENEKWLDVNVISSLLKAFFRKLPEPLITEDLYQSFINANRADDPMRRMLSLKRLLHELPEHHFETFKHLAAHLKLVAIHGEQNKMDSRNLAIVFGPTLIRRKDEDMATLVKDMSDQCRIVESVIVNNEWFFSSWEEDSVVPDDDGTIVNAPVSSSKNLLAKLAMNEDDRGREVNPKDIVFSIIQAANKKLKGKDKKYSLGALDDGDLSSECGPNERNIDQEVARRRAKSEEILTQDSASESTSTSSASKSFDHQDTMPMDHHDTYPFSLSMGAVSTDRVPAIGAEDYMDWVFVRTQSDSQPRQGGTSRPQVLNRHYSEDSLLDKNDEIEISHGSLHNNCSLSRDRLDRLWRLEQEARALRETEERRQREREKHRREQQRIEQELARTKKELEIEESHSLEDILRHTEFAMQISDFANRLGDFGGRGLNQPDSSSLLSEYSTTSSDNKDVKFFLPRPGEGGSRTGCASRSDLEPGVAAVSAIPRHMLSSYEDRQGQMGKRAGSLETIIDGKCNNGKRSSGRWKGKRDGDRGACPKSPEQADGKAVALVRSSSVRRGSLDSLRDFYDKQDHRSSWASTDSEDGSDLLTSLTTTFDQKLQILLNPKFKLTGAAKKQLSQAESTGSGSTVSDSTEEREVTRLGATAPVAPAAAVKVVPPMRPEETNVSRTLPPRPSVEHSVSQRLSRQGDPSYDRSFRDPSLHRMHHRPDAKIGIASRFERGSSISSSTVPTSSVNQMSQSTSSLPSGSTGLQYRPFLSYREKPDSSTVKGVPGEATSQKLSASQGGQIRGEAKPFNVRSDSRPKTKSEKTEVNLSLSKLSKEEQNDKAAGDARKSTDLSKTSSTASGTKSGSVDNLENNAASGATVFVPHSPKKKDRRSARRHTVCGINDSEHLCAMAQLSQSKDDDPKLSAWEQLRPAVKPASEEESQTLISWLQKERLRMSASDLLGAENRTLSSSCSNLDETRC